MTALLENEILLLIGIAALAWGGYKLKALAASGAVGTFLVGIFIALGFKGYGLLLIGLFFVTSSFWSKYNRKQKESIRDMHEKGSQRDIMQVFANGGVPALIGLSAYVFPAEFWIYGFIASIAVANSDTWASEIGSLSKKRPFSIVQMKTVEPGTSGAISLLGTLAAVAGSALISLVSYFFWSEITITITLLLTAFGVMGCFIDTILGATVQSAYRCKVCGKQVEKKVHCQQPTQLVKGNPWVNNDVVNISSILIASVITILILM
ncbi:DUF92 domain-containing protein [Sutcliffiella horikoshii]|uniref:DUF92 domain-containing protein n=1 Tax=Sutcliffiella horikoshii TaxID=79883 RepID=A0A5D4T3J6_9BACI|nr:DUF92 domain-containing protein [Sutcliffiella horikoshii]TYS68726.1 DUF92 domain-containing protein [Sutcliffiella horikoshii]